MGFDGERRTLRAALTLTPSGRWHADKAAPRRCTVRNKSDNVSRLMGVKVLWTREQEKWTRDQVIDRFGCTGKCAGRFVQRQLNARTTMPAVVIATRETMTPNQCPFFNLRRIQ